MNRNIKLKPLQLIWVRETDYHVEGGSFLYVGELMSFPTPEGTIMVRRVPGHPGTLVELPLDRLELLGKQDKFSKTIYARIKGVGQFPTDMLRYDSCQPVSFTLEKGYNGDKAVLNEGETELIVAKAARRGFPFSWTPRRWSSFLWSVEPIAYEEQL